MLRRRHIGRGRRIGCVASILLETHCLAWSDKNACFVIQQRKYIWNRCHPSQCLFAGNENNVDDENNERGASSEPDLSSIYNPEDFVSGGILLDPDTYLQAESLLQPDGSLKLDNIDANPNQSMPKMQSPLYQAAAAQLLTDQGNPYQGNVANSPSFQQQAEDDEMLLRAVTNIKNNPNRIDPEELHQQVFAEEEAYLKQSEGFRKSLTSMYDEGVESPMAKARREAIESYNEMMLEKLLEEIDEIEKLAPTQEEALRQAKTKAPLNEHVFCNKCGCRVTPDVIERFHKMREAREGGNQARFQKIELLCDACYGAQFRAVDEAKTRLGVGNYGDASTAKMYDNKKMKPRREYNDRDRTRQRFDTSSMFSMPREARVPTPVESRQNMNRSDYPDSNRVFGSSDDDIKNNQSTRSRSRQLGSRELTRRMQRDSSSFDSKNSEEQETSKPSGANEEWTQVMDRQTKRRFYWNKTTGEMRKSPPE